ncbi:hypothetical protein [Kibdelosporangium aridum]|uniref:Uncharacterized protein n=1 Tax=Kibdelosporangium aridum TaxID=2030 RepID=A0A1Y5X7K8_KIBAR|nr:hypothetical protein [Kibdelosporangium aridum]SMC73097.1 hypothetical protein SAMN05661093_01751 [Kibdelosporangium aridum]
MILDITNPDHVAALAARVPHRCLRFLPDRMLDRMTTSDLRKHYPAETRGRTTAAHTN